MSESLEIFGNDIMHQIIYIRAQGHKLLVFKPLNTKRMIVHSYLLCLFMSSCYKAILILTSMPTQQLKDMNIVTIFHDKNMTFAGKSRPSSSLAVHYSRDGSKSLASRLTKKAEYSGISFKSVQLPRAHSCAVSS